MMVENGRSDYMAGMKNQIKLIGQGAEAKVLIENFMGLKAVKKIRVKKDYREPALDKRLRLERTKTETRLIHRVKQSGIRTPYIYDVTNDSIIMEFIDGDMLYDMKRIDDERIREAARILARLHSINVIHGDFTPANLLLPYEEYNMDGHDGHNNSNENKLVVIDFGLGFMSNKIEDKGIDVLTMKKSLISLGMHHSSRIFIDEYQLAGGEPAIKVIKHMKRIEQRVRYA